MFDFTSLHTAFESVKENHGCAGVDGETIERFEEDLAGNLQKLRQELAEQTYFPLPLMKILVAKKNGEPRGLCIPTVRDRVVQTAVLHRIGPLLEKEFEECSFGYRKGRSIRQVVYRIKEYAKQGYRWVVDADIDAFFDTVDHDIMLAKCARFIPDHKLVTLIALWLKAEIWDGTSISILQQGLPQGSPVSPVLANLFLDELDEAMLAQGYRYIRYADDYVILCKTSQQAKEAMELSEQVLAKLLLKLDEGEVISFEDGFTYLGVTFVKSMVMTPFPMSRKKRQVLYYPPPFDLVSYLNKRGQGAGIRGQERQRLTDDDKGRPRGNN